MNPERTPLSHAAPVPGLSTLRPFDKLKAPQAQSSVGSPTGIGDQGEGPPKDDINPEKTNRNMHRNTA